MVAVPVAVVEGCTDDAVALAVDMTLAVVVEVDMASSAVDSTDNDAWEPVVPLALVLVSLVAPLVAVVGTSRLLWVSQRALAHFFPFLNP